MSVSLTKPDIGSTDWGTAVNANWDAITGGFDGSTDVGPLKIGTGNWVGLGSSAGRIVFTDSTTDYVSIMDGRLGVGTTSPAYDLHVYHNVANAGAHVMAECGSTGNGYASLNLKNTTTRWVIQNDASGFLAMSEYGGTSAFVIDRNVTSATTVRIRSSGVSIGAASPSATLDVRGSALFNGDGGNFDFRIKGADDDNLLFADASAGFIGIGTNSPGAKLDVRGSVMFNYAKGEYNFRVKGVNDDALLYTLASQDRVGIGTDSPSAKLDVNGDANVTSAGYKVAGTKVVGAQQGHISDPSGGSTQDAEARAAINSILYALEQHGLLASS